MRILIAPNAFKHSIGAAEAAEAIRLGLEESSLDCSCVCFPIADGGDGTGTLLVQHFKGEFIECEVHDPLFRKIKARFGVIDDGRTAVIEMAEASGSRLLQSEELDPLRANTYGTGELIRKALDQHVKKIIIGMGGSATVDGASGMLKALGLRFMHGHSEIIKLPRGLNELREVVLTDLDSRLKSCQLVVLCDVENPLLGEEGAATVFGPQKGAGTMEIRELEDRLKQMAGVAKSQLGVDITTLKGGGAAGGAAAGLQGFLNAKLVNGIDHFLELCGFDEHLKEADLVITAEGSIDLQTLKSKGPAGVARAARKFNVPVIALGGTVPLQEADLFSHTFDVVLSISNEPASLDEALSHTYNNLKRTAFQLGQLLSLSRKGNRL